MSPAGPGAEPVDLGHGVLVSPAAEAGWTVTSRSLYLHWHPRCAAHPGTAVCFQGEMYEAEDFETLPDGGWRWRLVAWIEGEVARTVAYLGAERVEELAAVSADDARRRKACRWLVALLPLSGLLPQRTQQRLEREVGFPASRATVVSALCEIGLGALSVLQLLVLAAQGGWFLPPFTRWLVVVGPVLLVEGLIRHRLESALDQPVGSLFLAPLAAFEKRVAAGPRPEDLRPTVVSWDPAGAMLELTTVEPRADWVEGGVLRFRGQTYRLVSRLPRLERLVYRFEAVAEGAPCTLQLKPAEQGAAQGPSRSGPGILETMWRSLLMSLAPAELQERWFAPHGTSPLLVTLVCAGFEVFGSGVNLLADPARGGWALVDLAVLLDGAVRLLLAAVRRGPAGSALGLALVPLYRRWVATLPPVAAGSP